jgi:hypothetical protein
MSCTITHDGWGARRDVAIKRVRAARELRLLDS